MAEQEACADLVEKASEEVSRQESKSSINGESLLLPLLQGLLDAPEADQPADSGTESGEDLRSGLILEVQSALDKLSASLKSSTTNITPERRDSLLQLVTRLQAGLCCQITPSPSSERRSSFQGRFSRKKQRPNRHTVGVTSEELEDARRLMEEIAFREPIPIENALQKQNSEGSVLSSSSFKPLVQKSKPVKNATPKPFTNSTNTSQSHSGTSSTVDTPTETSESLDFLASSQSDVPEADQNKPEENKQLFEEKHPIYNQSISVEQYQPKTIKKRPLSEAVSLDYSREVDLISVQKAVTQAAAIKQLTQLKSDVSETQDSETDDDASTVKIDQKEIIIKEPQPKVQPQPDLVMQTNPIYYQPNENESDDEFTSQYNEKANRFNSKKLKMKRANTIDIPKPLKYYEDDDDESEGEDGINARRHSYFALRGPIRVGKISVDKKVPQFQPKTESDHKFLAFINKHTENDNNNKTSPWAKQNNNWNNKFGNIKNNFEKIHIQPNASVNSARNFWKSADDTVTTGKVSHIGPKISRQSAKNLQQMFEEKQKQNQQKHWNENNNIVTGSLKVDTKAFEGNKNVKIVTQPNPINKFSHAPLSAFKPVKKFEPIQPQPLGSSNITKIQVKDNTTPDLPMYLYSPKPFSPQNDTPSPINHAPWIAKTGESRVLSIAASKFENQVKEQQPQRRASKEKIVIPQGLKQHQPEKLTSPFLVKNLGQTSSVKKLSGQYDHFHQTKSDHVGQRVFVPGENYSIQYNTPSKPKPNVYNAEYTITQRINLPPAVVKNEVEHNLKQMAYQKEQNVSYGQQIGSHQQVGYNQPLETHNKQNQGYESEYELSQINNLQKPYVNLNQQNYVTGESSQKPNQNLQSYGYLNQNYATPKYNQNQNYAASNQNYVQHNQSNLKSYTQQNQIYNQKVHRQQSSEYQTGYDQYGYIKQISNYQHLPSYQTNHNIHSNKEYSQPTVYQPPVEKSFEENEQQFTSSYQFQPQLSQKPKEKQSSPKVAQNYNDDYKSHSLKTDFPQNETPKAYARQCSQESVEEYTAISSKVMRGPVTQQAVTVQQNAPKNRDQYDFERAFNLKTTLQKFNELDEAQADRKKLSSQSFKVKSNSIKLTQQKSLPEKNDVPKTVVYNNVTNVNVKTQPVFCVNDKPMTLDSLEINEKGESVLTSKFHIPVKPNLTTQALSKSESWHQICQENQKLPSKPSPRASPNSRTVTRSKSSHTLAVPKQYEAGMSKQEMAEKQKSLAAYFGGTKTDTKKTDTKKTTINRIKTSQKISTQRQNSSSGLSRSKTLPDIVCLDRLDDDNIDEVFEEIFKSST